MNSRIKVDSVIYAILYSLLIALIGGIVSGFFNYFFVKNIGISLESIFFFGVAYLIGRTTSKVVNGPHLVYSIIAGLFIVISYIIMDTILVLVYHGYSMMDTSVFFNPLVYLESFWLGLNPVTGLSMGILNYLLSLLIFIVGTYVGVQQTLR
ncbi:MAG: hypothetical protein AB7U79_08680 [Candidatus Izemoplasmatales bacterium]